MIQLGQVYTDMVSGLTGIAESRHEYLHGCERVTLQPEVSKDGEFRMPQTFDAAQLKKGTLCGKAATPMTQPVGVILSPMASPEVTIDGQTYVPANA